MTPIKLILLAGTAVHTVDHADQARLIAVAPTPTDAEWLANSLAMAHEVDVRRHVLDSLPVRLRTEEV